MTLRNRVLPTGEIVALPFRGLLMGNRGVLHDERHEIVRPWNLTAWLICRTEFNDRHRTIMAPDRYTELFFLDEVNALAAGHRPCFECRRERFNAFLATTGHGRTADLDRALHTERLTGKRGQRRRERTKRLHDVAPSDLPVGAMVLVGRTTFALGDDGFIAWAAEPDPSAYLSELSGHAKRDADTLWASLKSDAPLRTPTPPTTLRALRNGYEPQWHPSAEHAERLPRLGSSRPKA